MRDRRRTTIAALAGGVALASAGFAIGSQSGDGSADAAKGSSRTAAGQHAHFDDPRGGPRGPGGPLLGLRPDELGVTEAQLRQALEDLRPTGDPGEELAAALAKALGIDQAKVEAELENLRPGPGPGRRHGDHAADLAKELGMSAAKVRAAFDAVKPDGPPGPRPDRVMLLDDLAEELGVTQAKLRAALDRVHPGGPRGRGGPGHPRPGHGDLAADLAQALDVEAAAVEKALEDFHTAKHAEFAQKLADELGIDVDKVTAALPPRP